MRCSLHEGGCMNASRPEERSEVVQTTEEANANQQPLHQRRGRNVLPDNQEEIEEESLPNQPQQEGIFFAEDRNGRHLQVEVVILPIDESPKKKGFFVRNFAQDKEFVLAIETGLSFRAFVGRRDLMPDLGAY